MIWNRNVIVSTALGLGVVLVLQYVAGAGLWSLLAFVPSLVGGPLAYEDGMNKGREIMRQVWNLP